MSEIAEASSTGLGPNPADAAVFEVHAELQAALALKQRFGQVRVLRMIGNALLVWGMVWTVCYVASYLLAGTAWERFSPRVHFVMDMVGVVLAMKLSRSAPVRGREDWRPGASWFLFLLFGVALLILLGPVTDYQKTVYIWELLTFALTMVGIWIDARLILPGLALMALGFVGYAALPHTAVFFLWSGLAGGGGMIACGALLKRQAGPQTAAKP